MIKHAHVGRWVPSYFRNATATFTSLTVKLGPTDQQVPIVSVDPQPEVHELEIASLPDGQLRVVAAVGWPNPIAVVGLDANGQPTADVAFFGVTDGSRNFGPVVAGIADGSTVIGWIHNDTWRGSSTGVSC